MSRTEILAGRSCGLQLDAMPKRNKLTGTHRWVQARRCASGLSTGLDVGRPCTWALHCNFRTDETNSLVEPFDPFACGSKYPSHTLVLAHRCADKRAAYAFITVPLGDNHHGNIAIRHSVGEGTQEANDLAIL